MKHTPSIGTWLSIGSPVVAELAALSGFAWVLVDLEHGCGSESGVLEQLLALRGSHTRGIVRVGAPHPDLISKLLDLGADGIMVPRVQDAEQARAVVRAAHYAPRGARGYSRTVRTHAYGLRAPEETPSPQLLAQIETLAAVRESDAIAAVDGIDVLFVGPADLQHDLLHGSGVNPPDYEDCLARVVNAARRAGKAAGILLRSPSELGLRIAQGFTHVAVQSDLSLLREAFGLIMDGACAIGGHVTARAP
jgi:2-dehydro-3-deoxyglucarate aldolase/4-hydroxy-2-oxoheptanedioate aldolase